MFSTWHNEQTILKLKLPVAICAFPHCVFVSFEEPSCHGSCNPYHGLLLANQEPCLLEMIY